MAIPVNNTNSSGQSTLEVLRSRIKEAANSYLRDYPNPTPQWSFSSLFDGWQHRNQQIARAVINLANDNSYTAYAVLRSDILHIADSLDLNSILRKRLMRAADLKDDDMPSYVSQQRMLKICEPIIQDALRAHWG